MPLPNGGRLRRLRRLVLQIAAQAHVPIAQPRITARNGIANQVNARLLRHVRRAATAGAGAAWGADGHNAFPTARRIRALRRRPGVGESGRRSAAHEDSDGEDRDSCTPYLHEGSSVALTFSTSQPDGAGYLTFTSVRWVR